VTDLRGRAAAAEQRHVAREELSTRLQSGVATVRGEPEAKEV
jgi:hypothetical protein